MGGGKFECVKTDCHPSAHLLDGKTGHGIESNSTAILSYGFVFNFPRLFQLLVVVIYGLHSSSRQSAAYKSFFLNISLIFDYRCKNTKKLDNHKPEWNKNLFRLPQFTSRKSNFERKHEKVSIFPQHISVLFANFAAIKK